MEDVKDEKEGHDICLLGLRDGPVQEDVRCTAGRKEQSRLHVCDHSTLRSVSCSRSAIADPTFFVRKVVFQRCSVRLSPRRRPAERGAFVVKG